MISDFEAKLNKSRKDGLPRRSVCLYSCQPLEDFFFTGAARAADDVNEVFLE